MRRTAGSVITALLLMFAISGCGTMLNMAGMENLQPAVDASVAADAADNKPAIHSKYARPAYPFGGVGNDVAWIKSAVAPIDVIGAVADIPFSLVGDILTVPCIAYDNLVVVRPTPRQGELMQFRMDGDVKNASPDNSPAAKEPR